MNKLIRVVHILIILGYFLTGIHTQVNLNSSLIDFNNVDSMLEIEACSKGIEFIIKSYEDESLEPYRIDSKNYLTNDLAKPTCFLTKDTFTLDENTEFLVAIYLGSVSTVIDWSFVEIRVLDVDNSIVIPVMQEGVKNEWNAYYYKLESRVENAKVNQINRCGDVYF